MGSRMIVVCLFVLLAPGVGWSAEPPIPWVDLTIEPSPDASVADSIWLYPTYNAIGVEAVAQTYMGMPAAIMTSMAPHPLPR